MIAHSLGCVFLQFRFQVLAITLPEGPGRFYKQIFVLLAVQSSCKEIALKLDVILVNVIENPVNDLVSGLLSIGRYASRPQAILQELRFAACDLCRQSDSKATFTNSGITDKNSGTASSDKRSEDCLFRGKVQVLWSSRQLLWGGLACYRQPFPSSRSQLFLQSFL